LSWHDVGAVVPGALAIVIVGFAESRYDGTGGMTL
jgi:hypothetical protein